MTEAASVEFSRGISPQILLSQVRNTVPYLFDAAATEYDRSPYLRCLREAALLGDEQLQALSHFEYFRVCVSAHFGTVSSFVPTDVDNQIRFRLWPPQLPIETLRQMARLVLDAVHWDLTVVSDRYVRGPATQRVLSGMSGEWFSVAAAAYCAIRKKDPELAKELEQAIRCELIREAEIFSEFARARDGVGLLKAATTIAHNLGDLDRVMDQWNLEADDLLRVDCYKAGHDDQALPKDQVLRDARRWLVQAGHLNKEQLAVTSMADENHRHFALRAAKCLRRSRDLLLPVAPFYDEWGARVGRHPALSPEDVAEVVLCLMEGFEKLKPVGRTQTYPRALAGIESTFSGGLNRLCQYLPAKAAKTLRSGQLRTYCSVPRKRFEEQLAAHALSKLKSLS
jgi:hypothetical protein